MLERSVLYIAGARVPAETVIAQRMRFDPLGMLNSPMKDFFDLWVIARSFQSDGVVLATAVAATLARHGTALPTDLPLALRPAFSERALKQSQWRAFLQRTTLAIAREPLPELIAFITTVAKLLPGEQPASLVGYGSPAVQGAPPTDDRRAPTWRAPEIDGPVETLA